VPQVSEHVHSATVIPPVEELELEVVKSRRPKAYEDIAAQLIQQIVKGQRSHGERLPSETVLADEFGVSRATIREALRALAARDLIRTAKGMGGGSYVQVPSIDHIADSLSTSLNMMSSAKTLTVEELLEARELLEVPAARLAATRRSQTDVERLLHSINDDRLDVDAEAEVIRNTDFHGIVIEACGNQLLSIAAQPVFMVLRTGFMRTSIDAQVLAGIQEQHHEIALAIDRGDADSAGKLMREHLDYLRPTYETLPTKSTGLVRQATR
jgi:GntR family transcriptional regulator, transcriptional repressor for pyruvate dehydrogenase complex